MDLLSITRTLGGLGIVLGILWGALWLVRRYDIQLPGRAGGMNANRLQLVERLAIDARRSVTLVRRDGIEHLILIAPEGHVVIETGLARPPLEPHAAADATSAIEAARLPTAEQLARDWSKAAGQGFGTLVAKIRTRVGPVTPAKPNLPEPRPHPQPARAAQPPAPVRKRANRRRRAKGTPCHA